MTKELKEVHVPEGIPAEFDVELYRSRNADIRNFSDAQLLDHWEQNGMKEGRCGHAMTRAAAVVAITAVATDLVLEIGPYTKPVLRGNNVEYSDRLDAEDLRARALAESNGDHAATIAGTPESIHYVGTSLALVPSGRFQAVLTSHCIEHQPDLVAHLNDIERVLTPGGRYWVMCPDKRYCFDHHLAESTPFEVIDAHLQKRTVHCPRRVLEHRLSTVHNDAGRHWAGDNGPPRAHDAATLRACLDGEVTQAVAGEYVDVHAWQFTPESFRTVMTVLNDAGMVGLVPEAIYPTLRNANEFIAVLRRPEAP